MNHQGDRPMNPAVSTRIDAIETLAEWWDRIGETPTYPTTRNIVERLLAAMDFEIPGCGLEYLQESGLIAWPGENEWEPADIIAAVGACQMLQWFRCEPDSVWWERLSAPQRLRATMRIERPERFEEAERLLKFHPKHLAILLLNAPDRATAEMVHAALESKLEALGIDW